MHFFGKKNDQDDLSKNMQDEAIKIASMRLGKTLPEELIAIVRQRKWSYMGLEMIIDTVRTIDTRELEKYLAGLD